MRSSVNAQEAIAYYLRTGDLKPVGRGVKVITDRIKADLLKPIGLETPDLPVYIANSALLPEGVSASTKFGPEDAPPHLKKPIAIFLSDLGRFDALEDNIATIAHELIHASIPFDADAITGPWAGHGPIFTGYARAIGLVDDPRATNPGPAFTQWVHNRVQPELKKLRLSA